MGRLKITLDTALCVIFYISCLLYSFYKNYEVSNDKLHHYYYLEEGWSIFNGRRRDDYDFEWEINKQYAISNALVFGLHAVALEFVRIMRLKQRSLIMALLGCASIYFIYNSKLLAILFLQNVSFFGITFLFPRASILWVKAFLWIGLINSVKLLYFYDQLNVLLDIENDQLFEFSIIISWNVIKCTCFCLDRCKDKTRESQYRFVDLISYSFYFPLLLYGPVIIYDRFKECLKPRPFGSVKTLERLKQLIWRLFLCLIWSIVMEIGQHFFYINIIPLELKLLKDVNLWVLYGLGYLMGQFFFIKYVVFYGIGIAFGQFDGLDMPRKPICIGRVHLYSDMWKFFDRGLYEFLFKYIYTELCTKTSSGIRKIMASLTTFVFIYVWHGLYTFVMIWSMLNWICIMLEGLVKQVFGQHKQIAAIVGTHAFILSVLSNFFFFAREDVGYIYIHRTYYEHLNNYLALYAVAYCFYRTGEWVKSVETNRRDSIKKYF
ncbi:protein-cysteine N-palmitoyltransferase Rasp [Uranotaenia lowii]|uniref:protein-cysteine N-palmitoyltransferase Rasp n=1 Tax=Uranotaenia lowii TaxID=190385 RepID=UPI00247907F4|nr:protein-cysteine N-palmitoyltransferase Rasp [Uranotaenia lowii]